jgi:hypothetical protein
MGERRPGSAAIGGLEITGYLLLCARVMTATVFSVSVLSKVRSRSEFASFIDWFAKLKVVSPSLTRTGAVLLITLEVAIAALLAVPATAAFGLATAAAVLVGFGMSMALIARRGPSVPCRCFGSSTRPMGATQIARNLALAAIAAAAAALGASCVTHPADTVLAVLSGAAAAALIIRLDDILELFSQPSGKPRIQRNR